MGMVFAMITRLISGRIRLDSWRLQSHEVVHFDRPLTKSKMGFLTNVFKSQKGSVNSDIEMNLVVLEYRDEGELKKLVGKGLTQANDCVEQVWHLIIANHSIDPSTVTRIYSEWHPSPSDVEFIKATFPQAQLSFTFDRPTSEADWPSAMRKAIKVINRSI